MGDRPAPRTVRQPCRRAVGRRQQPERTKFNPLADWSWADVWHYIASWNVPTNPLHDAFMPSIGCAPCTRAIAVGEPFRAGRWWWEEASAKECGLHGEASALPLASAPSPALEPSA